MKQKIRGVRRTINNKTTAGNKVIAGRKAGNPDVSKAKKNKNKAQIKSARKGKAVITTRITTAPITSLVDLATTPEAKANVSMMDMFLAEKSRNSNYVGTPEFKGVGKRLHILSYEIDRPTPQEELQMQLQLQQQQLQSGQPQQHQQQQPHQQQGQFQKKGPALVFKCRDLDDNNRERIWTTRSVRAVRAVKPKLDIGINVLRIWTEGVGTDTYYYAEPTDLSKTKEEEAEEYKKIHGGSTGVGSGQDTSPTSEGNTVQTFNPKTPEEMFSVLSNSAGGAVLMGNATTPTNDETETNADKIKTYKKGYTKIGKIKKKRKAAVPQKNRKNKTKRKGKKKK